MEDVDGMTGGVGWRKRAQADSSFQMSLLHQGHTVHQDNRMDHEGLCLRLTMTHTTDL